MIIFAGDRDGLPAVDFRITAGVGWLDAFALTEITRPLPPDWLRLRLIIRPAYDHTTLIRNMVTDGVSPEIIIDDADRAAFSMQVAQDVVADWLRKPDGTAQAYAHWLTVEYASAIDNREHWRGLLYVEPGLRP